MSFPWSRYFLHCFHHEVQEMYSHCNGRPCVLANVGNQVPDVCINLLLQSIQESVICLFIQGWQNDSARVDECGVCKQKWEANRCRRNSFQNRDWPHETTSHWVLSWVCLAEGMATWLVATTFSRAKEEFLQPLQAKSKSSSESTICMKIHIGRLFDCIWHANCNINELYIYTVYIYVYYRWMFTSIQHLQSLYSYTQWLQWFQYTSYIQEYPGYLHDIQILRVPQRGLNSQGHSLDNVPTTAAADKYINAYDPQRLMPRDPWIETSPHGGSDKRTE